VIKPFLDFLRFFDALEGHNMIAITLNSCFKALHIVESSMGCGNVIKALHIAESSMGCGNVIIFESEYDVEIVILFFDGVF
jgi:hypothetical protein